MIPVPNPNLASIPGRSPRVNCFCTRSMVSFRTSRYGLAGYGKSGDKSTDQSDFKNQQVYGRSQTRDVFHSSFPRRDRNSIEFQNIGRKEITPRIEASDRIQQWESFPKHDGKGEMLGRFPLKRERHRAGAHAARQGSKNI